MKHSIREEAPSFVDKVLVTPLQNGLFRVEPSFVANIQVDTKPVVDRDLASVVDTAAVIKGYFVDEISEKTLWDAAFEGMMKAADPGGSRVLTDALREFRGKLQAAGSEKDRIAVLITILANLQERSPSEQLNTTEILHGAMRAMMAATDSFGAVRTQPDPQPTYPGIGVQFRIQNGGAIVVSTVENGPARRAGVCPADAIINIGGRAVAGLSEEEIFKMLRGPSDTPVDIALKRAGRAATIELKIIREEIKSLASIRAASIIADRTGYIRLRIFDENTDRDFERALRELTKADMRGLVLDLRDNPGGPLDQPIRVTSRFLPRGDLVVYTRGRAPKSDQDYRAVGRNSFIKLPLVVLVNGGTAAASEIVAGALQDHGRATIVGTQTAGSGSTQSVYRVANGARLLLTTARWFTPKNRSIRPGAGLKPDITVPDPACEERGPSDQSDPQLQRALEVITGLIGR